MERRRWGEDRRRWRWRRERNQTSVLASIKTASQSVSQSVQLILSVFFIAFMSEVVISTPNPNPNPLVSQFNGFYQSFPLHSATISLVNSCQK